ncbi:MAG: hypothetical protein PWR08_546, partial [Thermoanaerobacterium sp.]|nr:hypothetical protein [Thermoanaerobacterium sp.]
MANTNDVNNGENLNELLKIRRNKLDELRSLG